MHSFNAKNNLKSPCLYVTGANTDVGKTWLSCLIAKHFESQFSSFHYLKPFQTGGIEQSDASKISKQNKKANSTTFFVWEKPVSPHLTCLEEEKEKIKNCYLKMLETYCKNIDSSENGIVLIEGSGGVLSPTPWNTTQADLFRELTTHVIVVGDSKLGGIHATQSSLESLKIRGFDVVACVFFEEEEGNTNSRYVQNDDPKLKVFSFSQKNLEKQMPEFIQFLRRSFVEEINRKEREIKSALDHFWWPFTQHQNVQNVNYIHSAFKDHVEISRVVKNQIEPHKMLLDGSASWWTQNLGHGNINVTQAASHALGKYGHTLFPQHIHTPAVELSEHLIEGVGKSWAQRVFFSDNGSTSIEVALKMASGYLQKRDGKNSPLHILGLKDSYHGDTLGAMNVSSPSVFNQSFSWYSSKNGVWLDYPEIKLTGGKYKVEGRNETFENLRDVFSPQRIHSALRNEYTSQISLLIQKCLVKPSVLLIEPVLMGSAGMKFIDPLFQRVLIEEARRAGMVIIVDEVFTGFWRIGAPTGFSLLESTPDIACFAKGITGGALPLGVTLANEKIFNAFLGEDKSSALLHGHSYTAYPAACAASAETLKILKHHEHTLKEQFETGSYWDEEKIKELSSHPKVKSITHLGSVLAVELLSNDASGYLSQTGQKCIESFFEKGVQIRPLGNVIYIIGQLFLDKKSRADILSLMNDLFGSHSFA